MTDDTLARLLERIERAKSEAPPDSEGDFFIADHEVPVAPTPAIPRPWSDVERGDDT